jgi:hypothetical protein
MDMFGIVIMKFWDMVTKFWDMVTLGLRSGHPTLVEVLGLSW